MALRRSVLNGMPRPDSIPGSSQFQSKPFQERIGLPSPPKTLLTTWARRGWTLKSFRDFSPILRICCGAPLFTILAVGWAVTTKGALPFWIRNLGNGTDLESAFFRSMALPYGDVSFRRPPLETRPALGELIRRQPASAELYSLRALEDEQQLDFIRAEEDWKLYVEKSTEKPVAQLALADFYHRRLRAKDEIAMLSKVANTPSDAAEAEVSTLEQRSWRAFERIVGIIQAQGLPKETSLANYRAWILRYPKEQQ